MLANHKSILKIGLGGFLILLTLWGLLRVGSSPEIQPYNSGFNQYVNAFTTGEISRQSPIRVRFTEVQVAEDMVGKDLPEQLFSFYPEIEGVARWENTRTLSFFPSASLPSGQNFQGKLSFDQIIKEVSEDLKDFPLHFGTRPQQLDVEIVGAEIIDSRRRKINGIVRTSDYVGLSKLESVIEAELDGDRLPVVWTHDEKKRTHHFAIEAVERTDTDRSMEIRWNAKPLGVEKFGREALTIPALGSFVQTGVYTYEEPQAHIVVEFSEPLEKLQDLEGLVKLEKTGIKTSIEGNRLKIYPKKKIAGEIKLKVSAGIRSASGLKMKFPEETEILFSETKPELRLIGKGTVLPNSGSLPFIFEAKGLRSVDVRVIKIHENNIPQFLQVNKMDQSNELKRVGQPVLMKEIELGGNPDLDLNQWNRHSLDLSSLINTDPGAIYEVALGFRRSYTFYTCENEQGADADVNMLALEDDWYTFTAEEEDSYWDYYYYDSDTREDPCNDKYYHSDRIVKRNVLASDLGLIAKKGSMETNLIVTDLKSTQPLSGVKVEVYDYQNQLMASGTTDSKGMASTTFDRPPYLMVAQKGKQRGYLRLDDGTALSLSRFDVGGNASVKGLKGFIYGERGVWRPGDEIYLTFMLEDKEKTLPASHPVIFEFFDPRGRLVEKTVSREGQNGFYPFPTQTEADAPTGNYRAKVSVGGATFEKTIKVETIVPNRLKMELDFGLPYLSNQTKSNTADLKVNWLHGAIAKGMKADVKATLRSSPTRFSRYTDYVFDDPVRRFEAEEKTLFEGNLNEEGIAKIPANLSAGNNVPGMLTAYFNTKVFEPGGGFSVDRFNVPFHAFQTYVGIKTPKGDAARGMLLTDEDHTINIASVNPEGKPVSSEVTVTLYKLSWKWWWDKSQDNIGTYNGKVHGTELQTETVQTTNGNGTWKLRVDYPQWGRYLIRAVDKNGHATGKIVYIDWPGWAGRAMDEGSGGAQMLTFTSSKPLYKVGEQVELNIPTGFAGRALVSVESGTKVLESYWVEAVEGVTKFSFTAKPTMAPNIFVNVTLLQPHAQTKNDRPIRLYGIIPVKVEDPQTRLQPQIAMADQLEPNSRFSVKVSESQGGPMTYTLAVVDEGLLGLTRFQTPDPWSTFYQRQALGVKTWDIFDHVLGAYGGEVKSLLSIGGGADGEGPDGKKPDRFKPVVKFLGPFDLKAGETKTHNIQMPNYIGAVRTMVVAGNNQGAYGRAEKSTPVIKPLMVLGSLPRVVGPGESVRLPVTVFANDEDIRVVNVHIDAGRRMLVDGDDKQVVRFYGAGEKMAYFNLGVLSSLGMSHITITAQAGGETAVYEADLLVRNPNPRISEVYAKTLEKGQEWKLDYEPVGMRGTRNGTLEVSSIPPLNLAQRLKYLIRYPYGCIEQTTSGVFPQVYLSTLLELSSEQKEEVDKNLRAGIKRLKSFQLPSGAMSYWPGNGEANHWGTNYAGHFMLEAEKAGYNLPDGFKDNWINYQRKQAQNWDGGTEGDQLTQAYRLYLLALAGSADLGSMNRMRQRESLSNIAKWNLAAAYHLAGQKTAARKLTQNLGLDVANYQELGGTFGSTVRDQAVLLQALSIMDQRDKATPLVQAISDRLSSKNWLNTQATAYCLVAMARYVGDTDLDENMRFSYQIGRGSKVDGDSEARIWQTELESVDKGRLTFKNEGKGLLYARLILDGIPQIGDTTNAANELELNLAYLNMKNETISPLRLPQGSDFKVQVKVKNTSERDYQELALNQVFPSGWEIHNTRLNNGTAGGDAPEYQDIRDDRVYSFFDLNSGETKTFYILLNASYLGRFYLPTVTVEAMYDRSIHARQGGQWVDVIEASGD